MSFTDFLENAVLNDNFRDGTPHLQMFTADPGEDASGVANAVGSREAMVFGDAAEGALNPGEIATEADITCDGITPAVVVTHVGIWDAAAAGNLLDKDNIRDGTGAPTSVTVGTSGEITFTSGSIVVTLA